ncbi:MAG: NAD(P)H-hydrate dehydratase [candidate division WOR-3 bacterium]
MLPVVTGRQMQQIDRLAMENWGISGLVLMENAGRSVVDYLTAELSDFPHQRFLVICGKGNNGGDGLVITRHLLNRNLPVECAVLGKITELKGDARTNAQILLNAGFPLVEITAMEQLSCLLSGEKVIIDAIFGTGLASPPTGIYAQAIELINQSGAPVVSVDIPSGVNADTGEVLEPAVRARITITMALPKLGLLLYPGKSCAGKLLIADIGIPRKLLQEAGDTFLVDADSVRKLLPFRPPDGHKGTFGNCLLVCGSRGFTGAACLTAMAAVRAGAGLVRLAYPESLSPIIESAVLEPVKHPLPETQEKTLSLQALEPLARLTAGADAVAIGPGISTHPETRQLLMELLPRIEKPLVIDADGLNNLAGEVTTLSRLKPPVILTPHPGELSRLTGIPVQEINRRRVEIAREFSSLHNLFLVLKGAPTVIAAPDRRVFINPTGNSGLGSGGTGDVLTGLLAGLLAQGASPLNAAISAVFIHGLAADIGDSRLTEYSLAAGDLLSLIPQAMHQLLTATGA